MMFKGLSGNALKVIAIVAMTIDHLAWVDIKPCISCQLLAVSYQRKAICLCNHCNYSHKAYAIDGGDTVNTL